MGEHIDDTPPPPDQPIIRQAMAFNWDKAPAAASVPTYQASAPAKPIASNYYLPGQAPLPTPAPASAPPPAFVAPSQIHASTPVPLSQGLQPPLQPPPTTQLPPSSRKNSSSRKKKSDGTTRHFNDQFSTQTGRFRLGSAPVQPQMAQTKAAQPPPTSYGPGPYSSMYRMETNAPTSVVVNTVLAQPAPKSRKTTQTSRSTTSNAASSSTGPSPAHTSQSKASGSKQTSTKNRSSTKQGTSQRQSGRTKDPSGSQTQYYRRDYEKDTSTHASSSNTRTSSKGRSQGSATPTSRYGSQPPHTQEAPSPSLSTATLNTNSGDNHASSTGRSG